jgi:hypothetical protein
LIRINHLSPCSLACSAAHEAPAERLLKP